MLEKCKSHSGERNADGRAEQGPVRVNIQQAGESQNSPGLIRVGGCPPGDELEERQFITDPDFHPLGGDELGGGPNSSVGGRLLRRWRKSFCRSFLKSLR